ncbi:unnamed protein product [marine sediment metagenome]|uniref:Uncharacterized protein n=1 Tax=marine sediment metagenome TaxID=412755 RepID=X1R3F5_9ZZZZ
MAIKSKKGIIVVQPGNGKKERMQLNLTRERATAQTIENLITAGVLLRSEVARYEKVLDSCDNTQLVRLLLASHELREASGEIYRPYRPDARD